MFCHKCGTQIDDEVVFCPKCGAKVISADANQQENVPISADIKQQQPDAASLDKPNKRKLGMLPLILGVIVLVIIGIIGIIAIAIKVLDDGKLPAVDISETYMNEEEGISFKYPSSCEIVERSDYGNYYSDSDYDGIVVLLVQKYNSGKNFTIEVAKSPYDPDDSFLTSSESYFKAHFDRNVSIEEFSDIDLNGVPARMIVSTTEEGFYRHTYFYAVGSNLYRVDFMCKESLSEYLELFVSVIMDSYTITYTDIPDKSAAGDTFEGEILYKDIPVSSFFDSPAYNVAETLGLPSGEDRDDDIRLYISDTGEVSSAEIWTVSDLAMDGVTLNRNRDGLIQVLGEPDEEGYGGGYFMKYYFPSYSVYFELGEPDSVAWRVSISPVQEEGEEIFSYDTTVGFSESLEYYSKLSGSYDGRRDQKTLSVSIYSSLEEGETAIGTVGMYVGDEWYYIGEIVAEPEWGVYQIATDTGEDVVLAEYLYDNTIVLELYVDGEFIDEYWMVEHYEP